MKATRLGAYGRATALALCRGEGYHHFIVLSLALTLAPIQDLTHTNAGYRYLVANLIVEGDVPGGMGSALPTPIRIARSQGIMPNW